MFEYCSLVSGSSGNCHFIKTSQASILIDVGISARRVVKGLEEIGESMEDVDAIFISHIHSDHTRGLEVLAKNYGFMIYGRVETLESLNVASKRRMRVLNGPVDLEGLLVESFELPHDAPSTLGFKLSYEEKILSIATDLGYMPDEVMEMILPSDFLVLEANHDEELVRMGPYPYSLKRRILGEFGHLSNEAAGRVISQIYKEHERLRFVMLAHLSEKNNYPELAKMSVEKVLKEEGIKVGRDMLVEVAGRDHASGLYRIL